MRFFIAGKGDIDYVKDLIAGKLVPGDDTRLPARKCKLVADGEDGLREVELTINPNARRVEVGKFGPQKCIWLDHFGGRARITLRDNPDEGFELSFGPMPIPPRFMRQVQNSERVLQAA